MMRKFIAPILAVALLGVTACSEMLWGWEHEAERDVRETLRLTPQPKDPPCRYDEASGEWIACPGLDDFIPRKECDVRAQVRYVNATEIPAIYCWGLHPPEHWESLIKNQEEGQEKSDQE